MGKNRRSSSRPYVAVIVALLVSLIGVFAGMPTGTAVFAAVTAGFLTYAMFDVPRRYRRFGLGHIEQAVDQHSGQFGKTYPEESVGPTATPTATPPAALPTRLR